MRTPLIALFTLLLAAPACCESTILVFSKTAGFRHKSIPAGIEMLRSMAEQEGWNAEFSEDSSVFAVENMARFDAIVFLSTTGDIMSDEQMALLRAHLNAGKGFVGIHAASDTEKGDSWYVRMVGAVFARHPKVQENVLTVHQECGHPSISHLGPTWTHTDEWYDFKEPVAEYVTPLLTNSPTTYPDGKPPGGGHPVAWFHVYEGGRVFYSALGHTEESFSNPEFVKHVREGLRWAAGAGD